MNQMLIMIFLINYAVCFGNFTQNWPLQMQKTFINIANDASYQYYANMQSNMRYIKKNMEKIYGQPGLQFFIFIQTQRSITSHNLSYISFYAQFNGINVLYPLWSYYIATYYNSNWQFVFLDRVKQGEGLTYDLVHIINTAIMENQPIGKCLCDLKIMNNILNDIYLYTGNDWGGVCDDIGTNYGVSFTQKNKKMYGAFRPGQCVYSLFLIKF